MAAVYAGRMLAAAASLSVECLTVWGYMCVCIPVLGLLPCKKLLLIRLNELISLEQEWYC